MKVKTKKSTRGGARKGSGRRALGKVGKKAVDAIRKARNVAERSEQRAARKEHEMNANIPELIKAFCDTKKLTQLEAAEKIGVNDRTFQSWAQGRNAPRGLALKQLLKIIGKPNP